MVQAKIEEITRPVVHSVHPRDHYEELSAYRSLLRSDLAAVQLDDAHDIDGNALYRLQFRAHVFPRTPKNRWGIAELMIQPPELDDHDVRSIYFTWLAHLTSRLNWVRPDRKALGVDDFHLRLGRGSDLYDVAELDLGGVNVHVAAMYGHRERIKDLLGKDQSKYTEIDWKMLIDSGVSSYYAAECDPTEEVVCECRAVQAGDVPAAKEDTAKFFKDTYKIAKELLEARLSVDAIIAGFENNVLDGLEPKIHEKTHDVLHKRVKAFDQNWRHANAFLKGLSQKGGDEDHNICAVGSGITVNQAILLPDDFCEAILGKWPFKEDPSNTSFKSRDLACGLDQFRKETKVLSDTEPKDTEEEKRSCGRLGDDRKPYAVGTVYAYHAAPVNLEQKISTVASAANSASMALGLAASIPQYGTGIDAGLKKMQAAVGKASAIEHAPLIVGFATAPAPVDTKELTAEYGWVFGPPVGVNAETQEVEFLQRVASHGVFADLSIPGWWPRIKLQIKTGWVSNWESTDDQVLNKQKVYIRRQVVRLPIGSADLDGFTDRIRARHFRQNSSLQSARIYRVHPTSVTGCNDKVTFIVKGSNLWREPAVYLRGHRHTELRVLPDMEGLAVTFDLQGLPSLGKGQRDAIMVVTRRGDSSYPVQVMRNCKATLPKGTKVTFGGDVTIPLLE